MIDATTETSLVSSIPQSERRGDLRAPLARPVRACPFGLEYKEEVRTTSNTSRNGLYFATPSTHYRVGMFVSVVEGAAPARLRSSPSFGRVVRIDRLRDGSMGIAVRILMR